MLFSFVSLKVSCRWCSAGGREVSCLWAIFRRRARLNAHAQLLSKGCVSVMEFFRARVGDVNDDEVVRVVAEVRVVDVFKLSTLWKERAYEREEIYFNEFTDICLEGS